MLALNLWALLAANPVLNWPFIWPELCQQRNFVATAVKDTLPFTRDVSQIGVDVAITLSGFHVPERRDHVVILI